MTDFVLWLQANQWVLLPVFIWDISWRLLAMWYASRQNQKIWFVALLIVNSVGLLPLVYLLFFSAQKFWVTGLDPKSVSSAPLQSPSPVAHPKRKS